MLFPLLVLRIPLLGNLPKEFGRRQGLQPSCVVHFLGSGLLSSAPRWGPLGQGGRLVGRSSGDFDGRQKKRFFGRVPFSGWVKGVGICQNRDFVPQQWCCFFACPFEPEQGTKPQKPKHPTSVAELKSREPQGFCTTGQLGHL